MYNITHGFKIYLPALINSSKYQILWYPRLAVICTSKMTGDSVYVIICWNI